MKKMLAFGLVALQFVLLATLVVLPHGSLWPVTGALLLVAGALGLIGAILAVLGVVGLGPALTASPIPREHAPLMTTGVYGLMRNPIYTGLMTGALGLVLFGSTVWHIVAWLALALLLGVKSRWEERMLIAEHPDYRDYGTRVGRFLPGLGRLR